MEAAASPPLPSTHRRWPLRLPSSSSLSILSPRAPVSPSLPFPSLRSKGFKTKQLLRLKPREDSGWNALRSSPTDNPPSGSSERWLLEPVGLVIDCDFCGKYMKQTAQVEVLHGWILGFPGDGDYRHIGVKVPLPDAFEIASNAVTVGRLPEKVDMVIPVATVSGVHARLEKKEGTLLVTDLDSTNGTYINDQKLRPGAVATVSPGSCVTFGDSHLAMFRVSKVGEAELTSKADESEIKVKPEVDRNNLETAG